MYKLIQNSKIYIWSLKILNCVIHCLINKSGSQQFKIHEHYKVVLMISYLVFNSIHTVSMMNELFFISILYSKKLIKWS